MSKSFNRKIVLLLSLILLITIAYVPNGYSYSNPKKGQTLTFTFATDFPILPPIDVHILEIWFTKCGSYEGKLPIIIKKEKTKISMQCNNINQTVSGMLVNIRAAKQLTRLVCGENLITQVDDNTLVLINTDTGKPIPNNEIHFGIMCKK